MLSFHRFAVVVYIRNRCCLSQERCFGRRTPFATVFNRGCLTADKINQTGKDGNKRQLMEDSKRTHVIECLTLCPTSEKACDTKPSAQAPLIWFGFIGGFYPITPHFLSISLNRFPLLVSRPRRFPTFPHHCLLSQ